jgi:hypothetical protein
LITIMDAAIIWSPLFQSPNSFYHTHQKSHLHKRERGKLFVNKTDLLSLM